MKLEEGDELIGVATCREGTTSAGDGQGPADPLHR
jgi:hypothetical protein